MTSVHVPSHLKSQHTASGVWVSRVTVIPCPVTHALGHDTLEDEEALDV